MSQSTSSAVLPIARVFLRMLIVFNWLMAGGILVLLFVVPHERWIMSALDLSPSPEADRAVIGLRAVAVIGLAIIPLYHAILKRLLAIVETVRAGDAFAAINAQRLRVIAWALLVLQLVSIVVGAFGGMALPGDHPKISVNGGFSIAGWLAVLLTFLLARVFTEGARMREELEGTV
jgi:hypothetical protein